MENGDNASAKQTFIALSELPIYLWNTLIATRARNQRFYYMIFDSIVLLYDVNVATCCQAFAFSIKHN